MKKNRGAGKSITDKLSADLFHKILIRLPIKSLLKLRCVSKSWCKIIDDPVLAHVQYDYGEVEQNRLLLRTTNSAQSPMTTFYAAAGCDNDEARPRMIHAAKVPIVKFQAADQYHSCYGYCNGLFYIAENTTNLTKRIVVTNPLRSQSTILPPIPLKKYYCWNSCWTAIGLGFDNLAKTFKMVYLYRSSSSIYSTLVHTLGTTSWREVPGVPACYCNWFDYKSVFVHGFLHWMTDPSMIENCRGWILAFDVSKETFKVIPHPELCFQRHSDRLFRILDIKENLGMLDLSRDKNIDIWVMDYEKNSWHKEYTIDITIVGEIHADLTRVIGLWKQDEILFYFSDLTKYWSCSMRTGDIKECEYRSSKAQVVQLHSLKGSLISISSAT